MKSEQAKGAGIYLISVLYYRSCWRESSVPVGAKGRFPFLCTLVGQPASSPALMTRAGSRNLQRTPRFSLPVRAGAVLCHSV